MADSTSVASDLSAVSRSKQVGVCVVFLDDTLHQFQITRRTLGNSLYAQVVSRFHVLEPEYFDLELYTAAGKQCWLERSKEVVGEWKKAVGERDKEAEREKEKREKSGSRKSAEAAGEPVFYFSVKYFVPDPTQLRAENTRYLYSLQIRRDLRTGQLFCSENTAALLISYIIQGDYGDFAEDFYLRARPFIRSHYKNVNLSTAASALLTSAEFDALEQKIATYHRMHLLTNLRRVFLRSMKTPRGALAQAQANRSQSHAFDLAGAMRAHHNRIFDSPTRRNHDADADADANAFAQMPTVRAFARP